MSIFIFFERFFKNDHPNRDNHKIVFDHYFFELKYYLNKDASIEDFSSLLNISTESIKKISNSFYNASFQMLINENRYRHFINELESPVNVNLSIESIIRLCGYESNDNFVDYVNHKNTTDKV